MEPTVALAPAGSAEDRRALDRVGAYLFSYLLGALLLGSLIYASGVWNFLGNTRLLDLLIRVGVVQYHDAQSGIIKGIPDLQYFLKSQDPIKWGLVELAAVIFVVFWLIKAVQFHAIAKFCGIRGTFTQHARAYLEGLGLNRLLPYHAGFLRMASAFQSQGATLPRVAQAIYLSEIFIVFEIVVFALYGLWAIGWSTWLGMLFWPLVILALSYLLVRSTRRNAHAGVMPGNWRDAVQSFRTLSQHPLDFSKIGVLSLLAFGLEDIAAYIIAMAFTSEHVILHVNFSVLLMGVVGSYIARLIPVTPGGIGQFEWGFAAALYMGGLGFPECVAIAVLDNAIRYFSGTFLLMWVYILRVDYSFEVLKRVAESKSPGS
jgi:uncharacterized membrane protein YbhN (UPF0104 family)